MLTYKSIDLLWNKNKKSFIMYVFNHNYLKKMLAVANLLIIIHGCERLRKVFSLKNKSKMFVFWSFCLFS